MDKVMFAPRDTPTEALAILRAAYAAAARDPEYLKKFVIVDGRHTESTTSVADGQAAIRALAGMPGSVVKTLTHYAKMGGDFQPKPEHRRGRKRSKKKK